MFHVVFHAAVAANRACSWRDMIGSSGRIYRVARHSGSMSVFRRALLAWLHGFVQSALKPQIEWQGRLAS